MEEANAELTLRLRQQGLATEFANFGLKTDDLQPVLDEACTAAAKGMECSFAKVLRYIPDDHCFLVCAGVGWKPGTVGSVTLGADLASPAGFAFQTGQPVLSNHLAAETRFRTPELLVEHGVHRAFNVLIPTPGHPYGVLEVDSPDKRDFTMTDTAFLQNLAATLANAIAKQSRIEELQRNTSFVQAVLDANPDSIAILTHAGLLESMSVAGPCSRAFDNPGQVAGRAWLDLWPDQVKPKAAAAFEKARSGEAAQFDAFCTDAHGEEKWWDVLLAPIGLPGDAMPFVMSISRDISLRVADSEAKDLLMLEIHHRVKNSLQLVQNLLSLQARAAGDGLARKQLDESAARVRTIAAIHDRLYKTGSATVVEIGPYLTGLVQDLEVGLASTLKGRTIVVVADAVSWPASEVPTLGLVLTELVTNALKYGSGTVEIEYRQAPGVNGMLTVRDQGRSLAPDFDPALSRGLGMRLVNGLLRGAGGLEVDRSGDTTCFKAHMPAHRG